MDIFGGLSLKMGHCKELNFFCVVISASTHFVSAIKQPYRMIFIFQPLMGGFVLQTPGNIDCQEKIMFSSATTATKKIKRSFISRKHLISKYTLHSKEDVFFNANTREIKKKNLNEVKKTHKIQAQGIQARVKCFQCNY